MYMPAPPALDAVVAFVLFIDVGADESVASSILIPLPLMEDAVALLIVVPFELYIQIPFAPVELAPRLAMVV